MPSNGSSEATAPVTSSAVASPVAGAVPLVGSFKDGDGLLLKR